MSLITFLNVIQSSHRLISQYSDQRTLALTMLFYSELISVDNYIYVLGITAVCGHSIEEQFRYSYKCWYVAREGFTWIFTLACVVFCQISKILYFLCSVLHLFLNIPKICF